MNAEATATAAPTARSVEKTRNAAFDFTKGALVLFMVLYHSLNYFREDYGVEYLHYLRFLPPSFIFISGFLLTHIYRAKYQPSDLRLHKRLFVRGVKLLLVFLILNVAVNLFVKRNFNGAQFGLGAFLDRLPDFLIAGRADASSAPGPRAVFEVLVPIAYLLILGGPLLALQAKWRGFLPGLFVALTAIDYGFGLGNDAPNLEFLCFGILGMVWGLVSIETINRLTGHWIILGVAYLAYVFLLTPFGAFVHVDFLFVQIVGVCLTEALLYRLGCQCGEGATLPDLITLLGRYSLLAYIVQILSLQLLLRLLRRWPAAQHNFPLGLSAAIVFTVASALVTEWARRRWKWADQTYRFVFA